jgi:hypothetical protein
VVWRSEDVYVEKYQVLEDMPSTLPFGLVLDKPGGGLPAASPDECPPFHYATHYTSAAIVLHYLVRLQPFSSCQVKLQNGRFDNADRLFLSVRDAW